MNVFGYKLPYCISKRLFGDRRQYGLIPNPTDPDLKRFEESAWDFYDNTQRKGLIAQVNKMGYRVIERVDFREKIVLEIGPGVIHHLENMKSIPKEYYLCDIRDSVLEVASKQLSESHIPNKRVLLDESKPFHLPFVNGFFDVIITLYSLEHLYPLSQYMQEITRVMHDGGILVGAVPCEGGFVWGLGRFLTTRRYVMKKYGINYDKLIGWYHPNFADAIIQAMDQFFTRQYLHMNPFSFLPADLNLVISFCYIK